MAALAPLLIPAALEVGKSLIDRLFPDKVAQAAQRAEAERALTELSGNLDIRKYEVQLSAIIAEAQSSDPWTSRARPSFLYVMYTMILASLPLGFFYVFDPIKAKLYVDGVTFWLSAIPEPMWWLFGAGYLGYTSARGLEKIKSAAR